MVTGYVPEPMSLFRHLEEAGAFVAADDYAAVGRRIPLRPPGEDAPPRPAFALPLLCPRARPGVGLAPANGKPRVPLPAVGVGGTRRAPAEILRA
jgi:hypothetical protein